MGAGLENRRAERAKRHSETKVESAGFLGSEQRGRAECSWVRREFISALEPTQGRMDGFISQLPCKFYLEEAASLGDLTRFAPGLPPGRGGNS